MKCVILKKLFFVCASGGEIPEHGRGKSIDPYGLLFTVRVPS